MQGKLVYRDGFLCIALDMTSSQAPETIVSIYPVLRVTEYDANRTYPIGEMLSEVTPSVYKDANGRHYPMQDGGKTMPIATDIIPIPPPKTKQPTRWYWGQWQKFTAAKGWKPA